MSPLEVRPHGRRLMCGVLAAFVATACEDPSSVTRSPPGTLTVSITTTGGDPDEDGYELVIGAVRRMWVAANDTVFVAGLPAGTHVLQLDGVAENCGVRGTHPLPIPLPSFGGTRAGFSVECEATGIAITTRTTGDDSPPGFHIRIGDAEDAGFVLPNGILRVTRLHAGTYTVSLDGVSDNCRTTSANPITVEVTTRAVIPVTFDVTCVRTEKRIAFVLDSTSGGVYAPWILVADSNGSSVLALTKGLSPAWSPDGKKLVYSDAECPGYYYYGYCGNGLALIDPDTRDASIPNNGFLGAQPSWSPDGNVIAFIRIPGALEGLLLAQLDNSPVVRLNTPAGSQHPTWSPDGQRVAFGCVLDESRWEICVVNRDGTGLMRLTNDIVTDVSPAWSPDGTTIAFATNRFGSGHTDIALMTPTGTDVRRLTRGFDPAWSPDGSRLVFAGGDGLFTIHSDGSNLARITTGQHRDPAWRP